MSNIWKADDDVNNAVKSLIANFHPQLAVCDEEIAVLFKEKASKSGDLVIPGKAAKAGALTALLGDRDYKFVLTLGADVWNELSDSHRTALLDRLLCACQVEEDPKTQEFKYSIRRPDVEYYRDEVKRHGFWFTSGAGSDSDLVSKVFGAEEEDSSDSDTGSYDQE